MDQLGSLLDRPKAYYNVDGVGELGGGFMCLAYALLGWMQLHAPKGSVWHSMYTFIIYFGLMCLIIRYGSKAIKKHITYPRTGFVEYRKRDTWLPMIMGGGISMLMVVALVLAIRSHWNLTTSVSLYGLLVAAGYAYRFARTVRWKWLVAWAMAFASLLIAVNPADLVESLADHSWIGALWLMFMLYGTMLLISGGISFGLYLRHTQAPSQEA
jgi:hypothetical protein